MPPIRVLVVDDSVVIRRLVTDALSADADVEVAAIASNGSIALQRIPQMNPDVVTLDVEMPEMDGLETLKQLRQKYPRLPVIMFSTLTQRGAEATLDALAFGATDYVTKPANVGSVTLAIQRVREQLLPKIKALGKPLGPRQPAAAASTTVSGRPSSAPPLTTVNAGMAGIASADIASAGSGAASTLAPGTIDVIAIGASTGGPNALAEIVPALPAALPVPIVIVQHMPPMFTRLLAERLHAQSAITVSEAIEGSPLRPGHALIAPGDRHMRVVRRGGVTCVTLNQDPPENSCRPAVDALFRSVAEIYGSAALAVVLTGMGQDGLRGCEHVCARGGRVLIQDEATSVVWGMPGFVARAGLAERSLPLNGVAAELVRAVMTRRPPLPAGLQEV
jgi:two-component system, chemotaxis family, protein-glutamate methylesterase/glutaminase